GIPLELVEEEASKKGIKLESVENFYGELARKNEVEKEEDASAKVFDVSKFPKTKELFYEDRFLKEFTGKVLGKIENYLVLDETCFYSEAGGQASDYGQIDGIPVLQAENVDGVILHEMKDVSKFKVGQKVFGAIDWPRRWLLMRHHTGTHVVNSAAREILGAHVFQAGSHKEVDKAHLDITHYRRITEDELKKIELQANRIVAENHPVTIKVYKRDQAEAKFGFRIYQGGYVPGLDIRIINIDGVDVEACCGTHVERTGDIGVIKIVKREGVKDGVERLTYSCSLSGIEFIQKREQLIKDASQALNVPEAELATSAHKILADLKSSRKEIEKLREQLNEFQKESLKPDKEGKIIYIAESSPIEQLTKLAESLAEKFSEALVLAGNSSTGEFVLKSGQKSKTSAKKFFEQNKEKFSLVGGGRDDFFRGKALKPEKLKEIN
ncbi:MAG: alanine--tRNA ligase-related protein, partial [Candidatus Diapherotrites archaeon]|nr:alanine--tRNA ligase-related protein [Candidatus Diapherotrites archaeon]